MVGFTKWAPPERFVIVGACGDLICTPGPLPALPSVTLWCETVVDRFTPGQLDLLSSPESCKLGEGIGLRGSRATCDTDVRFLLPPPSKLLSFVEGRGSGTGRGLRYGEPGSGYHFRGDPDWADPVPTFLLSQTPDLVHACL